MRVITLVAFLALSPLDAGSQVSSPTNPEPYVRMGYVVEGYFGEDYTTPPRQENAFFQGEPISFRIGIYNSGPTETTLITTDTDPQHLFRVVSLKAPLLPANFTGERPLAANRRRFLDEREVAIAVTFSTPTKTWSGGEFEIGLGRETKLNVGEGLRWLMSLPTNLEPGLYRVEVRLDATQGGKPLYEDTVVRFEVRAPRSEDRPELLRREALRRLDDGDKSGAREAATELLHVHPNSALAHAILETIAESEGRTEEAATQRGRKEALLKDNRDQLLIKYQQLRGVN